MLGLLPLYGNGHYLTQNHTLKEAQLLNPNLDKSDPEYLIKISEGKPQVFGVKGDNSESISCDEIVHGRLAWQEKDAGGTMQYHTVQRLKFPMSVGSSWTSRVRLEGAGKGAQKVRTGNVEHKVLAVEKLSTPKGELEVFKIQSLGPGKQQERMDYYSPKAKAIVPTESKSQNVTRTIILTDFEVSP